MKEWILERKAYHERVVEKMVCCLAMTIAVKTGGPTYFRLAQTDFEFYRTGLKRPDEIWAKKYSLSPAQNGRSGFRTGPLFFIIFLVIINQLK
jgi:hypothetical protein